MGTRLAELYESPNKTPQTSRARKGQKRNSAGGFSFKVSPWDQLDRFLILGSEGGTYYISPQKLTKTNAKNVTKLIKKDGVGVVNRIVEISQAGRAPRNDPALFALALCVTHGDELTRQHAYANLHKVARIGTHLFHFVDYCKAMGKGWGKGLRKAIARWYTEKEVDKLGYQVIKYKQRDGWSHRDLLRLAHPKAKGVRQNGLFKFMISGEVPPRVALPQVRAAVGLTENSHVDAVVKAIWEHDLPREAIPTNHLNSIEVWDALLQKMPITALVRNLGKMTNIGLIKPMSHASRLVRQKLSDEEAVRRSRIHPLQVLYALKTYGKSGGHLGKLTWDPVQPVVDVLDELFYTSFGNVEPTGKNMLLGLDVSGSMACGVNCCATGGWNWGQDVLLSCAEGAAAMAMVTARVEDPDSYVVMGFANTFKDLGISPRQRLDEVLARTTRQNFGSTNCSLPMEYALQKGLDIDTFCVYTDSETYMGNQHPFQALDAYRQKTGIPAKLVVVGMAANPFTIADPKDPGMLDVVGFDAGTPAIISDFAKAEIG